MVKRVLFETIDDVNLKLQSNVILRDDKPVYCFGFGGGVSSETFLLKITPCPVQVYSGNFSLVSVNDPSLSWKGVSTRLGYMNARRSPDYNEALYVQRIPIRKSYIGLHNQNTKISLWSSNEPLGLMAGQSSLDHHNREPYFVDMMTGVYPTVAECLKYFKDSPFSASVAFSRHFCIKKPRVGPYYLTYKQQDIAWADDPSYKWRLSGDFEYLTETLEHNKIAVST